MSKRYFLILFLGFSQLGFSDNLLRPKSKDASLGVAEKPSVFLPSWGNYMEIESKANFKEKNNTYGFNNVIFYEGIYSFLPYMRFGGDVSIAREYYEPKQFTVSDVVLKLFGDVYKKSGGLIRPRISATLPISDDGHDQSLRTSLQLRIQMEQQLGFLLLGYRPFGILNSHRYTMKTDRLNNSTGNINYIFGHRMYLGLTFSSIHLRGTYQFSRSSDYDGYTVDQFYFEHLIRYTLNPKWAFVLRLDNGGGVYQDGAASEYNLAIYNRETSTLSAVAEISF